MCKWYSRVYRAREKSEAMIRLARAALLGYALLIATMGANAQNRQSCAAKPSRLQTLPA